MLRFFVIATGGAIGTLLRYVISGIDYKFSGAVFPYGTLVVNLSGSLVIGFLWGVFERIAVSPNIRLFIFIGILGGFTTFSTFSLENLNLLRDSQYRLMIINIFFTNALGIILVVTGFLSARLLLTLID
ncbi:MAG: fluoride efflux transporter CrcB [Candidatus Omnitrophota bacterium]|jgi:CrcB protein|nr:MAG: fluoride efflux transporter CrcB [Candidatus Omnitrophota bacterium]